jgi:hypothetical protein
MGSGHGGFAGCSLLGRMVLGAGEMNKKEKAVIFCFVISVFVAMTVFFGFSFTVLFFLIAACFFLCREDIPDLIDKVEELEGRVRYLESKTDHA